MKPMPIIPVLGFLLLFTIQPVKCQSPAQELSDNLSVNPKITAVINEINKDSIYQTIVQLCSFATRSVYATNRRAVAEWTIRKFQSFGYENVAIDSFRIINFYPPNDSIWQYNVSAKLPGTSSPDEVYLLTAHPDSYNAKSDPRLLAPGANDDASGLAGMLEIARVLKKMNFQPFATIKFTTLSSEEIHMEGAQYYVNRSKQIYEKIRVMFSMDMIAYTHSGNFPVGVYQVRGDRGYWTGDLVNQCIQSYTTLFPVTGPYMGGNEIPFLDAGLCIATIIQLDYNNLIHTSHDSVQYLNMDMCREVTVANCAAVLNENYVPVPYNISSYPGKEKNTLSWSGRKNGTMAGYYIYRSTCIDSAYVRINSQVVSDTLFDDLTASFGVTYYYRITSVNTDNFESTASNPVPCFRINPDRELLVLMDAVGNTSDPPDSLVLKYYKQIFRDLNCDFIEASSASNFNPGILGHYKRVAWLSSNTNQNLSNSTFVKNQNQIFLYVKNHGNLFFPCPQPSALITSNDDYNKVFSPQEEIYDLFKIKEVHRMLNALFCGAYPVMPGYDSIQVDSSKGLANHPSHIKNIETFYPAPGGNITYLFDSKFDTTTSLGKMKGKPVGLEYLGEDFKVVLLSMPLYYMDSTEARNLVDYIITKKFPAPAGIDDRLFDKNDITLYQNYPNPAGNKAIFPYYIPRKTHVSFEVIDLAGSRVWFIPDQEMEMGPGHFTVDFTGIPTGMYLGILRSENRQRIIKIVVK